MDNKTKGAWIIHHGQKLAQVVNPQGHDALEVASKAGLLLSSLCASQEQSNWTPDQVNTLARVHGIRPLEQAELLKELAKAQLVDVSQHGVAVLGVTSPSVLKHTTAIFEAQNPNPANEAALELAESVAHEPRSGSELSEFLSDKFRMASNQIQDFLDESIGIGFVDRTKFDQGSHLYFNGNLFRDGDIAKTRKVLNSLRQSEQALVHEVTQELATSGVLLESEVHQRLGVSLFKKLQSISMFDVSAVNNDSETVRYVTLPSAFGKYGRPFTEDAMDLAKMFVACLNYGMTRSSATRGRIHSLEALVRKMMRGEEVGPAPAIGMDYRVLEMRGVVRIRPERSTHFLMRLLKPEIGEIALAVLTQGTASEQLALPSAAASSFTPPEPERVAARRRFADPSNTQLRACLDVLRTGGSLQ